MSFQNFYRSRKKRIVADIGSLDFWHKAAFGILCCERLMPNYTYYCLQTKHGDSSFLLGIAEQAWESILAKAVLLDLSNLEKLSGDGVNPDSSESMLANWAQDAVIAVYDLIRFFNEKNDEMIVDISWVCIETVQKYLFETYEYLEDEDFEYEQKITSFEEMKKEIECQQAQLDLLKNSREINARLIKELHDMQEPGVSSIGFG